jgi:hypothetical protein
MPENYDQIVMKEVERRSAIARRVADRLFHRVLHEGPRADEFYIVRPDNTLQLRAGCNTPRRIDGQWHGAAYVPYKLHYVRPSSIEQDEPIWHRHREHSRWWYIFLAPQSAVGIWGVRVENPKLFPVYHAFVCTEDPEGFKARQAERDHDQYDRYRQEWHLCSTEDEIVAAAIRCIKGKL